MFSWLVFIPTAGTVAGVVLVVAGDGFGAVLITASLVGALRTYGSARMALRIARTTPRGDL